MKQLFIKVSFAFLIFLLFSCDNHDSVDWSLERERILELHELQREYHFQKDSVAFANQLSDDFISVNRGEVTSPKRSETISRYHNYFSSVEFVKWDDVSEPVIRFSEDGTLAYTIVDKIVTVRTTDATGNATEDETHFAWTAIYRKYDEGWKIDCVTSTNKP